MQKKENNLKQTVLISGLVLDPVLGMTKIFVVFECACTIIQMISEPNEFDAEFDEVVRAVQQLGSALVDVTDPEPPAAVPQPPAECFAENAELQKTLRGRDSG
jgi:Zn-dependent membrane protease YugP